MKKKRFGKILSAVCAIATMTLCFSKVQAAPLENTESIDTSKSYIIYSGDTKTTLYDDGGSNEGWLRQGHYLDFDNSYSWKLEKNGNNFYLKNEGTTWYVKGNAKTANNSSTSYVVSDKTNNGNDKGAYSFEKVEGGYKLKSVSSKKYLKHGVQGNYVTFTDKAADASVWKIEEKPAYDPSKQYVIYSTDKNNTLQDTFGQKVGWLTKGKYAEHNNIFYWRIEANGEGGFHLRNLGTSWYVRGNEQKAKNNEYVVSDMDIKSKKGNYKFEKVVNGYKIKSLDNNKYMIFGKDADYITFTSNGNQASVWQIELAPEFKKPEGSITLWKNPQGNEYYRIPAIATANDGTLLAINDLRYDHAADLANHRIDLLIKNSTDNGVNWSEHKNLTVNHSKSDYGFGDAAIVADRDSDKVMILAAAGDKGFWHANKAYMSTRENPIKIVKLVSEDGGKTFSEPQDLTKKIYGLDETWTRIFAASGRIMQSRYVKVGDYNRIYSAVLVGKGDANGGNYVIYSDDFGDTWNVLGGSTTPIANADEAKIEELPNGNVIIASRTANGRNINVFTYDKNDSTFTKGQWESSFKKLTLGNGASCNGETYIVYAKDTATNEYKYLALQSLPTVGKSRKGVGIYYKELTNKDVDVDGFINGWSEDNFYMIQKLDSGYSTMSVQKDGKIAFLYEDRKESNGFDGEFIALDLKTITNGKYEMAFTGIGSEKNPYVVETAEQAKAVNEVFKNEKVNWTYKIAPEAPVEVVTAETTENSTVITWNKANDNGLTVGYNVYNEKGELLNKELITEARFEIQNLEAGKEYTITVKAVSKEGVESQAANFNFTTKSAGDSEQSGDVEKPTQTEQPVEEDKSTQTEQPVEAEKPADVENPSNPEQPKENEKTAESGKVEGEKSNSSNTSVVKSDNKKSNEKGKNAAISGKDLAKTGDITNVAVLIGGALLSGGALAGLAARKRNKR